MYLFCSCLYPFLLVLKSVWWRYQISFIFLEIGTVGVTGLSLETFKENWSPGYQNTNDAGVPDPEGSVYWNFK